MTYRSSSNFRFSPLSAALSSTALAAGLGLTACSDPSTQPAPGENVAQARQGLGEQAFGAIANGLPARFLVGIRGAPGDTWLRDSGVAWDWRYQYLTKGWVSNWNNNGPRDGAFAYRYFFESYEQGMIPAVGFYQLLGEPGGGESATLEKLQNASLMGSYFADFRVLLQQIRAFGNPVVVILETDTFGFAESQSGTNPNVYAAVADSGLPELAGMPNTLAGWGQAFLKLRQEVGATTAILGLDPPGWARGNDVVNQPNGDLPTNTEAGYWFYSQLGLANIEAGNPSNLAPNVVGETYDILAISPIDRDAEYYSTGASQTHEGRAQRDVRWSTDPNAPVSSLSFNRFLEYLSGWNEISGKRIFLWQIPEGNLNSLNQPNCASENCGERLGWKDNRPEYLLGEGEANRLNNIAKFADAGVLGFLFGRGHSMQSSHKSDYYTDGQLFLRSRGGQVLGNKSALALEPGQGWTPPDIGPEPPVPPTSDVPPLPPIADDYPHQYEFECDVEDFRIEGEAGTIFRRVGGPLYAGAAALAVDFNGEPGNLRVFINNVTVPGGSAVDFHLMLPEGCVPASVQPYMVEDASTEYRWSGAWYPGESYHPGQWDAVGFTVPADVKNPVGTLGLDVAVPLGCSGTLYVDTIGWPPGATEPPDPNCEPPPADTPGAGGGAAGGASGTSTGAGGAVASTSGASTTGAGGSGAASGSATGPGATSAASGTTSGGDPANSAEAGGCGCRVGGVSRAGGSLGALTLLLGLSLGRRPLRRRNVRTRC
jgi:hypothetical protein